MSPPSGTLALVVALALISGFADVITWVRFESFAGLQTGNMIFIGEAIFVQSLPGAFATISYKLAMIASHFFGVFLFCALAHVTRWPVRVGSLLLAALTAAAAVLDLLFESRWAACPVSASLGAMNFVSSPNTLLEGKVFMMTTLTTGNLQKCAKMLFYAVSDHGLNAEERAQTLYAAATILSTICGASLAGLALYASPFGTATTSPSWWLLFVAGAQCATLLYHDFLLKPKSESYPLEHGRMSPLVEPLAADAGSAQAQETCNTACLGCSEGDGERTAGNAAEDGLYPSPLHVTVDRGAAD